MNCTHVMLNKKRNKNL